jgi:hypothetical protein
MSITAEKKEKFLIPAGSYVARCFQMIHIGHVVEDYTGEPKEQNKVSITWELPTEHHVFNEEKGEQPCVISQELTLSMHEKSNLRRLLVGWRGKEFTEDEAAKFDITKLIGKPCLISIIHNTSKKGNTYVKISSISTLPKGFACPEQVNPSFEFTYTPFEEEKFAMLNEWMQKKVSESKEYKKATGTIEENQLIELPEGIDPLPF